MPPTPPHRPLIALFILGLVGLLCATTAAQSSVGCVPFQGSPATSGKCDPVVTYSNVYVALGQTYESVDEGAANVTKLAGAFVPYSCRQALITFACLGSFLECSVDTTTFTPSVVLPCRSVCERVLTECSAFAIENGLASLLPDCDKTVELNGVVYPAFPPDGLVDCNAPPAGLVVGYSQADCPYPLKYNQDGEEYYQNNGYEGMDICVYPCPDPMFSDGEWAGVIVVDIVLNFLSFWLSFFLVVTFLLMPQKRRFPALIFFYFGLLSAIVGFVCLFFPAVRGGIEPLVCTEGTPKRLVTMSNAGEHDGGGVVCIIQGIILYYCPMAAMFWWLFLVLTVFELIVLERSTNFIKRFHLFYHIVAWGFPLIGVVILLASKNIGALTGVPSCFMATDHEAYGWVLFYGPLATCLIIGSILMTLSVIKFARIRFRFSGHTKDKIEQLVRMILLVMAYFLILAYPLAFRIYQRVIQDDLIDALEEQVTCSATTATECGLTYRLNYGSLLLEVMDVSCYGIIIFITMCSSDMLIWWYYLLKAWATQSPRDALDISKDMIMGSGKWGESKNSTMSGATTKSSKNTNSHSQSFEDDENDGSINNEDL